VRDLEGLNRWERYWCRRAAFSRWGDTSWLQDVLLLVAAGVTVWSIHTRGLDSEAALLGGTAGVLLGAVFGRNVPIRADHVIARLTRVLDRGRANRADQA
jgi:hypothetical protein